MIDYEKGFANPFEGKDGIDFEPETVEQKAEEKAPHTRQSFAEKPYTQARVVQQPYPPPYYQQPYPGQAYGGYPGQALYSPPHVQPPYGHAQPSPTPTPSPYSQYAQAQYGYAPPPPAKQKREKKRSSGQGLFGMNRKHSAALVIIIIIACVVSGISGGLIGAGMNPVQNITYEGGPTVVIEPSTEMTTTEAVAKKVLSSVVGIESKGQFSSGGFSYGLPDQEIIGVGTGMIIDANGYILTNSHVVMDGDVNEIVVHLNTGEQVGGRLIWNDRGLDIAIIKISSPGLIPVELGDSDDVTIGSYVAAIGNPLGLEFSGSITSGVVSGLDRTITVGDGYGGGYITMHDLIQVDAAINSGNSGGPLLNNKGQVIGINTAKAQAEGMGFAIPINIAIPVVEKVIRDGSFERVFMGISAADVSIIREHYPNVIIYADTGACITDVTPGSPAEKGGLKAKDVIIAIDGSDITGSDSLIKALLGFTSGDVITVTYDREGEVFETDVTLLTQSELDQAQVEENPFKDPERGNSGR